MDPAGFVQRSAPVTVLRAPTKGDGGVSSVEFLFCRILKRQRFGWRCMDRVTTF
jgi:hypothetical protein